MRREIGEMNELFSGRGNYGRYRGRVGRCVEGGRAVLPYVAVFLRDVVHLGEGEWKSEQVHFFFLF